MSRSGVTRFATGRVTAAWAVFTTACAALTAACIALAAAGRISPAAWVGWALCTLMSTWILRTYLRGWRFVRDHPTLAAGSRELATITKRLADRSAAWRNNTEQVIFLCRRRRILRHSTWQLMRWDDDTIVDMAHDLDNNQAAAIHTDMFLVQAGTPVMLIPAFGTVRGSLGGGLESAGPRASLWRRFKTVRMLDGTGLGYATEHDLAVVLRQLADVRPVELGAD